MVFLILDSNEYVMRIDIVPSLNRSGSEACQYDLAMLGEVCKHRPIAAEVLCSP